MGCEPAPEVGVDPFGGEPECEVYYGFGEPDLPEVEVRIVNQSADAILVTNTTFGCGQPARHFEVLGSMGGRQIETVRNFCPTEWDACADWSEEPPGCLLCSTFHPPVWIEPGGSFEQTWMAWGIGPVELPASCNAVTGEAQPCFAPTPIGAGEFEVQAHAAKAADCLDEALCHCVPDERGSCALPESPEGLDFQIVAKAAYDGVCETIEIVFE